MHTHDAHTSEQIQFINIKAENGEKVNFEV
jgi:hypothetical protein